MSDFRELIRQRLRDARLSPAREAEIVEEMAEHLDDRYQALRSGGATEEEAWRAIVAELDQRDLAAELRPVEKQWSEPAALGATGGSFWGALWQDVRYGARVLRLNPAFTAVCVLSLALGIGANTAIFQLIDAIRLRTLPVKDPQELAIIQPAITQRSGRVHIRNSYMTNPLWGQVRAQQRGFSGVFAWGNADFNLATGGQVRYAQGLWVSGEFFDVLGIQPVLGRVLHPSDDHSGCGAPGAVISYPFWQREYAGRADVLNKTVRLEGQIFPILGVTPASFYGVDVGHSFDVAVPICSEPTIDGENSIYALRHGWWLTVMGRLKPGWPIEKAAAQLDAISPAIMQETLPPVYQSDQAEKYLAKRLTAHPASMGVSNIRSAYETPLWLLLAIAGLVLLIACANLANLMLARAAAREREIAVRLALGAARGRLIRGLLTESLLLAAAGALLGAGLARWLSQFLVNYLDTGDGARVFVRFVTDWRVLGFTAGLALLTCVLFGLAPALKATGVSPGWTMSLAGRGLTATRERFTLRRALVVAQVALSLVLVVTALLFSGSLRNILSLDAGFERDGVLIMDVDYSGLKLLAPQRVPFRESLLDRVRGLPGVETAAEAYLVPLSGNGWNDHVIVDGKKFNDFAQEDSVSAGFFKTLNTPLLAGRDFDERDTANSPKVAIVNQQFARQFFGGGNPLDRTFKVEGYRGEKQPEYQVVGLVKDTKYYDLREDFKPTAFYPQAQNDKPDSQTEVIVRSDLGLEALLASLRRTVADMSPAIVIDFHVFNKQVQDGLLRERLLATLSGFFGGLAVVLAIIGLYGVIAYMVVRRTNEIGIRMALGAAPGRILAMILRDAVTLLIVGLVIGFLLALAAGRAAATLLYGLTPHDTAVMAGAVLGLATVAVAAALLAALRAARLQPMEALRQE